MKTIFILIMVLTMGKALPEERWPPPPLTPNYVDSLHGTGHGAIDPWIFTGKGDPLDLIYSFIASLPRTKLILRDATYLHVTFTSFLFRFTDDVEFLYLPEQKIMHIRSASRVGISDLGKNKKRMNHLLQLLSHDFSSLKR